MRWMYMAKKEVDDPDRVRPSQEVNDERRKGQDLRSSNGDIDSLTFPPNFIEWVLTGAKRKIQQKNFFKSQKN